MTIREVIDQADVLRPNTISETEKHVWLAQLDGTVRSQIHDRHEGNADDPETGADRAQDDSTPLLVEMPYAGVYVYWLMAQIDLALGELTRYNNDMMLYNLALTDYAAAYKRSHLPKKGCQFTR